MDYYFQICDFMISVLTRYFSCYGTSNYILMYIVYTVPLLVELNIYERGREVNIITILMSDKRNVLGWYSYNEIGTIVLHTLNINWFVVKTFHHEFDHTTPRLDDKTFDCDNILTRPWSTILIYLLLKPVLLNHH